MKTPLHYLALVVIAFAFIAFASWSGAHGIDGPSLMEQSMDVYPDHAAMHEAMHGTMTSFMHADEEDNGELHSFCSAMHGDAAEHEAMHNEPGHQCGK
jgi:hypothetical protein